MYTQNKLRGTNLLMVEFCVCMFVCDRQLCGEIGQKYASKSTPESIYFSHLLTSQWISKLWLVIWAEPNETKKAHILYQK